MRRFLPFFAIIFCCASFAEVASVSYIRSYIQSNFGVSLPATGGTIASHKYLMNAIDLANQNLNGIATNYSAEATHNVVAKSKASAAMSANIKYCAAGTYLSGNDCSDCGIGHFCVGGSHRADCTYGLAACAGANQGTDPSMPASLSGLIGAELTEAQIAASIPATHFSDWEQVASCATSYGDCYDKGCTGALPADWQNSCRGCALGTIGPGVILFRFKTNFCSGQRNQFEEFMVFDRPVGFKILHVCGHFNIYLDENNSSFSAYTKIFPSNVHFCANGNYTNVSGIPVDNDEAVMQIYKLK